MLVKVSLWTFINHSQFFGSSPFMEVSLPKHEHDVLQTKTFGCFSANRMLSGHVEILTYNMHKTEHKNRSRKKQLTGLQSLSRLSKKYFTDSPWDRTEEEFMLIPHNLLTAVMSPITATICTYSTLTICYCYI